MFFSAEMVSAKVFSASSPLGNFSDKNFTFYCQGCSKSTNVVHVCSYTSRDIYIFVFP